MNVEILYKENGRQKMQEGVDALADAVKVTLGPKGRTVTIFNERDPRRPIITKDGVTVANRINFTEPVKNMGAQMVKQAAQKTAGQAGDGTTTATILAQCMITEGLKAINEGANPTELKKGIDKAVEVVVESLKFQAIPIENDFSKLCHVATISANNDPEIGKQISEAMEKVGANGFISLMDSPTEETTIDIVNGYQLASGYKSPYFVNTPAKMTTELDNCYVLIYDKKISVLDEIEGILRQTNAAKRPLLIIAEDIDAEALAAMVTNVTGNNCRFAAVKAPGGGAAQRYALEDAATITGTKILSETTGHKLKNTTIAHLGTAKHISISGTTTTITGGAGKKHDVDKKLAEVKVLMDTCPDVYEAERLKQRLAKLSGGAAVMYVGAKTEVDQIEKKYRIEDALCATRAATEEGILPGGGVAYIKAQWHLFKSHELGTESENKGYLIVIKALEAPLRQMLSNGGENKEEQILQYLNAIYTSEIVDFGFNIKTGQWENFFTTGVIDPAKVSRIAIESAASVATTFLTTEAVVYPG